MSSAIFKVEMQADIQRTPYFLQIGGSRVFLPVLNNDVTTEVFASCRVVGNRWEL